MRYVAGVIVSIGLSVVLVACGQKPAQPQNFDLVINNGRVMDPETNFDQVANVGITGGKIVAITKDKIEGKETIDANGLVVAPGFIDTHFHWPRPIG